jgi:hypothetical protein
MPLWAIFTKCPAPLGPQWRWPFSAGSGVVERFRHVDLDARDVVAIPDGLEERIREAEVEQVLDALLPEVVVDPENRQPIEYCMDPLVEGHRRGEVAAERFLDDDPRADGQPEA